MDFTNAVSGDVQSKLLQKKRKKRFFSQKIVNIINKTDVQNEINLTLALISI